MRVFVYGTLLKGEPNDHIVAPYVEAREVGRIRGIIFDYGPYPFLVLAETGVVHGEWVTIAEGLEPEALVALDKLEGYREGDPNNLYDRVTVRDSERPEMEGYVYIYPEGSGTLNIRQYPVIMHGDWRRRHG